MDGKCSIRVPKQRQTERKNKMKLTIQKATNSETKAKIDAAMKNGYLKYDNLSKGKKRELIDIMAIPLSTCSPTIMEYVMKCQMGMIDAVFFELKDGTPVKMSTEKFLEIFNIIMTAKEMTGFEWERVA